MFTEKELRELRGFQPGVPVLSLYLNTDPTEGNADAYRLRLRNMLKEVDLPDDLEVAERYIASEYDWSGRGLALFSCAPQGFFRAYPLGLPVRSAVTVGERPYLRPLEDLMECYGNYGVALVDKQGARLFWFNMGELQEQEGVMGEEVRRTKHGGASSLPGARSRAASHSGKKVEEVVDRNMKDTAAFAVEFFQAHHVRRLLIGGTEENVKAFKNQLPKSWQSLVMATFPMAVSTSTNELMQKVLEIGDAAFEQREKRLAADLTQHSQQEGGKAVTGLEPVLKAASEGRIATLVMTEGFHHPAFMCAGCGRLTVLPGKVCPICGGAYYDLEDVRDTLSRVVMRSGGDVEVIRPAPGAGITDNIGALLRS